ncbi:MAG: hypothetical protein LBT53_02135 [Puniceicoccales bacterium]|nr:hypothetical protein [Puniceicoccales bacterium]
MPLIPVCRPCLTPLGTSGTVLTSLFHRRVVMPRHHNANHTRTCLPQPKSKLRPLAPAPLDIFPPPRILARIVFNRRATAAPPFPP